MVSTPFLQGLLDASTDPLIVARDDQIFMANEAACSLSGFDCEGLIGQTLSELLSVAVTHPSDDNFVELQLRQHNGETCRVYARRWVAHHEGADLQCTQFSVDGGAAKGAQKEELSRFRRESTILKDFGGFFEYNLTDDLYTPSGFQRTSSRERAGETGFSLETYLESVYEEDRERVRKMALRTLEQAEPLDILARFIKDDGEIAWIWGMGDFYTDSRGKTWLTGLSMNVSKLIHDQRSLEKTIREQSSELLESEARYRSMVEGSEDFISIVNDKCEILYLNRVLAGLKQEDVIGASIDSFIPEDQVHIARGTIAKVFSTGEAHDYEIAALGVHGSRSWYLCRVSPMMKGEKVIAATIISRDITEQHLHHIEVENLNQELEKQVDFQTAKLSSLLRTAEELSQGLDAEPIYSSVTSSISETLLEISEAAVWLHDPVNSLLVRTATTSTTRKKSNIVQVDDRLVTIIEELGTFPLHEIVYLQDADSNWAFNDEVESPGTVACLSISHNSFGNTLLFLRGKDDSGSFSADTTDFLKSVVAQTALALSNVDLYEQQRRLSIRMLHIQEQERRNIAIELHDQLGGLITSLKMILEEAEQIEPNSRAIQVLGLLGNSARNISGALRPSTLDDFGLLSAVNELITTISDITHLQVAFEHNLEDDERFSPSAETVVYRVIQEATTNAEKHAHATHLSISLTKSKEALDCKIQDDGRGFDLSDQSILSSGSLGLKGMQERVALIGGVFEARSDIGEGTIIAASVPSNSEMWW